MPGAGVRARESQAPCQILLCDEQGTISTGSAFFFEDEGRRFLVTNWHNVSGKDPYSGESLRGRPPTFLKARLATVVDDTGGFTMKAHNVELYSRNSGQPLWLEHPSLGQECDLVAIPFDLPTTTPSNLHAPVNLIHSIRIPVRPGCTVFIVGYPHNLSVHIGWPIWKAGYIASEPFYDVTIGGSLNETGGPSGGRTLPAFFIDALTRSGMSGSPVFANYIGNWDMTDPYKAVNPDAPDFFQRYDVALGENRLEFVGIYSGRVPTRENEAALGLCFRVDAIQQVCASGMIGKHPHFL